jgi:hypothetical protein
VDTYYCWADAWPLFHTRAHWLEVRRWNTHLAIQVLLVLEEQSIPGPIAIQFRENDATAASIAEDVFGPMFLSKYTVFLWRKQSTYVHEVASVHLSYLLQLLKYILERWFYILGQYLYHSSYIHAYVHLRVKLLKWYCTFLHLTQHYPFILLDY